MITFIWELWIKNTLKCPYHDTFNQILKGAGGSTCGRSWKSILWCFLKEESEIYQLLFTSSKILILAKVIARQRSALMCNSIARAIFNRDYPKMAILQSSKSIFSYIFWAIILKLSGYVLGMKIKISIDQNFDLGL